MRSPLIDTWDVPVPSYEANDLYCELSNDDLIDYFVIEVGRNFYCDRCQHENLSGDIIIEDLRDELMRRLELWSKYESLT